VKADAKIYVAGHRGLAGSAIVRRLRAQGYANIVTRTHAELELLDAFAVKKFFEEERPQAVFLAAAKVGGILANASYPAEFIAQNLAIQTNVIDAAYRAGVERLVFLGSSCIYPRDCPQPIREEYLLTGPLEPTNRPYAIAKIAGIEMCWSYNRQYGTRYVCAMPTNLYGPGDNYDLKNSHVLPALIRKFHEAKASGAKSVTVWGSGRPRREFLYSDDMADACIDLAFTRNFSLEGEMLEKDQIQNHPPLFNVGCGEDLTIAELAERVRSAVGSDAAIVYDGTTPDGTPQKLLDVSRMAALGWRAKTGLDEGLRLAYASFLKESNLEEKP
jgi:GDP-L-fucose synthase